MSEGNTVVRSLHDLSLAAWFGGSLMGATGLNGAASLAKDPAERLELSSKGWAIWTPWQIGAVAVHTIGGLGLIGGNKKRLENQDGALANTVVKTVVTVAAAGVTAYAGILGKKVLEHSAEGGTGATDPSPTASTELASAQKQLKIAQWAIPVLTGVLLVLGARQGEQQRGFVRVLEKLR